jgi:hypothetical protein
MMDGKDANFVIVFEFQKIELHSRRQSASTFHVHSHQNQPNTESTIGSGLRFDEGPKIHDNTRSV